MDIKRIKRTMIDLLCKALPPDLAGYMVGPENLSAFEDGLKSVKERLEKARKPYPGEDTKISEDWSAKAKSYVPSGGTMPHYSDSKSLSAYKKILNHFNTSGVAHHGHVDYDPKSDQVLVHTNIGRDMIREMSKGKVDLDLPKPTPTAENTVIPAAPSVPAFGEKE